MDPKNIRTDVKEVVRSAYSTIAKHGGSCCSGPSCCGGSSPEAIAADVGYSIEEVAALPEGANMGLSCG